MVIVGSTVTGLRFMKESCSCVMRRDSIINTEADEFAIIEEDHAQPSDKYDGEEGGLFK